MSSKTCLKLSPINPQAARPSQEIHLCNKHLPLPKGVPPRQQGGSSLGSQLCSITEPRRWVRDQQITIANAKALSFSNLFRHLPRLVLSCLSKLWLHTLYIWAQLLHFCTARDYVLLGPAMGHCQPTRHCSYFYILIWPQPDNATRVPQWRIHLHLLSCPTVFSLKDPSWLRTKNQYVLPAPSKQEMWHPCLYSCKVSLKLRENVK